MLPKTKLRESSILKNEVVFHFQIYIAIMIKLDKCKPFYIGMFVFTHNLTCAGDKNKSYSFKITLVFVENAFDHIKGEGSHDSFFCHFSA